MTLLAPPIDAPPQRLDVRWDRRPLLGWTVRIGSLAGPLLGSFAIAWLLTDLAPTSDRSWLVVARWALIATASSLVLVGLERGTRRLLPIAALYDLSLTFPDRAPSRFKVAMRTGTTQQLERRIAELRAGGLADPSVSASQRVIELVTSLSVHDRITRGHSERVRAYSQLIADELGLSEVDRDRLRWASLLHDVGKLLVPTALLNKSGSLTADEYELIKTHPENGRRIVAELIPWLGDAARAVWEHHEHWDGGGYPRGLSGTDISLAARIVAVADAYDVMTSSRSYKDPVSPRDARAELARCAGTHFDPMVVRAFLNVSIGRVRRAAGPLAWAAQLAFFPTTALGSAPAAGSAVVLSGALSASSAAMVPDLPATLLEKIEARVAEWAPEAGWERGDITITAPEPAAAAANGTDVAQLAGGIVVTPPRQAGVAPSAAPIDDGSGGGDQTPVTTIVVTLPPSMAVDPPPPADGVPPGGDADGTETADDATATGDDDHDDDGHDGDETDSGSDDHGDEQAAEGDDGHGADQRSKGDRNSKGDTKSKDDTSKDDKKSKDEKSKDEKSKDEKSKGGTKSKAADDHDHDDDDDDHDDGDDADDDDDDGDDD